MTEPNIIVIEDDRNLNALLSGRIAEGGVGQPRHRLGLAPHPRLEEADPLVARVVAAHELEGDSAVKTGVVGLKHLSHSTCAEGAEEHESIDHDRRRGSTEERRADRRHSGGRREAPHLGSVDRRA